MDSRRCSGRSFSTVRALAAAASVLALLAACAGKSADQEANWSPEKLYAEAKEESAAGNYERAGKLYERLEGRASGSLLAQQAQIDRAYALYRTGDKAQSLSVLERFVKLHPTSPAIDYALYLQGLVNFNDNLGILGSFAKQELSERDQQASRDSYQSFKQLVDQYPQSRYASDAQIRMNYIVNSLANYEVHVARYYYRRGAYLAAANRAQQTVQEFQTSPAAEEALAILVRSYDKLGLDQLRDDADRVLRKSFPTSDFIGSDGSSTGGAGSPKRKSAWWQFW